MGISVVLLAEKEEKNLMILLPLLKKILKDTKEKYEILVIDTMEPLDNTKRVCEKYDVIYLNQEEPKYAGAFKTGIKHAKYDKIQVLDCDFSHDPNVVTKINEKFNEGYDLVIGSRYIKGGKTLDSKTSQIMSKILNFVYRKFLGIKAKDISTSFRMYDAKQLKSVKLDSKNFDVVEEVVFKMIRQNPKLKISEVPITFNKRLFCESKRSFTQFIGSYIKTLFCLLCIKFGSK